MFLSSFCCWAAFYFLSLSGCAGASELFVNVTNSRLGNIFTPNNTIANVGDVVNFVWSFGAGNHTITQGLFEQPCVPTDGGFQFTAVSRNNSKSNNTEDLPSFAYQVQDTSPVYYFDRKGFHCQNGMVGAINAPTSGNETIEDYEAAAQLVPRGPPIAPKSSVNVSQIAVTALLSSAAVIVLLGVIIFMFLKRRKAKKKTPEIEIELCKVGGGRDCHVQELEVQESPVELPGMLPDSPKFYELYGSTTGPK